jgi:hypothetical protein
MCTVHKLINCSRDHQHTLGLGLPTAVRSTATTCDRGTEIHINRKAEKQEYGTKAFIHNTASSLELLSLYSRKFWPWVMQVMKAADIPTTESVN